MNGLSFRQALAGRDILFGTAVVSSSPQVVPVVADLGLDYVFIDTEHIPIDRRTLAWMCQAYEGRQIAPLVRIPAPDPYQASMVLDGGAAAVLAPYIETPDQVQELAHAVKDKPVKGQLRSRMGDAQRVYADKTNAGRSLLVNIESVPAMERLGEILSVPGLDGIIIGPHDLSVSLGVPEQWEHPVFVDAVETILGSAREADVSAGIHVIYDNALEQHARWLRAGANIVLHLADILAFRFAMQKDLKALRRTAGVAVRQTGGGSLI